MDSQYSSASGFVRVCAAIAAMVVTGSLFGAVALGLTGEGEWSVLAQSGSPAVTVQAAATA